MSKDELQAFIDEVRRRMEGLELPPGAGLVEVVCSMWATRVTIQVDAGLLAAMPETTATALKHGAYAQRLYLALDGGHAYQYLTTEDIAVLRNKAVAP